MSTDNAVEVKYLQYVDDVTAEITNCVQTSACQPILFIGSGLSKRYFGGPSWDELLAHLAKSCPLIDKDFAYYKQSTPSPLAIGEEFARRYHEWAWSTGKNHFPADMFVESVPANAYIKFKIAEYLRSLTPQTLTLSDPMLAKEIDALRTIRPHAIVTTNYDQFLELVFPEYHPVIGQQIIRGFATSVGEIFSKWAPADALAVILTNQHPNAGTHPRAIIGQASPTSVYSRGNEGEAMQAKGTDRRRARGCREQRRLLRDIIILEFSNESAFV